MDFISILLLNYFLNPILAFTIYFCFLHSIRHSFKLSNELNKKNFIKGFKEFLKEDYCDCVNCDCVECVDCDCCCNEIEESAEYQGRKVKLNKPTAGDVKKFKVYVKNEKGNVVKVNFGDPNMEIKRDDPARRKSFRARHNCDNPGPKWKARYWSCYQWRAGAKVER